MNTVTAPVPGIFDSLYSASISGVNWLSTNSKALASSAGDLLSRVASAVAEFFSSATQTIGHFLSLAKDSLLAAKDHVSALPRSTQIIAAVSLVGVSALGYMLGKRAATPVAPTAAPAAVAAAPVAAPTA